MRNLKFYKSRVEQLADHLRERISQGAFSSPLPSIRELEQKLGMPHCTLVGALKILQRDGLVRTQPGRGVHLVGRRVVSRSFRQPSLVRWLLLGRKYKEISSQAEILVALGQRLTPHGIRLSIENCSKARLRAIRQEGHRTDQMLLLASFPLELQKLFAGFERSALVLGHPFPGIRLPFITVDVFGALHHAVWLLVRRGFSRISLLIGRGSTQPIEMEFQRICMEAWPPIQGEVVRIPEELVGQSDALRRLAKRVGDRHAFIVNSPVPVGPLMMALMERGVTAPQQVEAVAMNATSSEIRSLPLLPYYPSPIERFSKAVCRVAVQYFEQGTLPPIRLRIPLRLVAAKR